MSYFARTPTNDIAVPRVLVTDPAQCARQQATDVLNLWQLEWFLNRNDGFNWPRYLGQKIVSTSQLQAAIESALLTVTGVLSVTATVSFDRVRRAFSYSFEARIDTGQILRGGSNQAFQVSGTPAGG